MQRTDKSIVSETKQRKRFMRFSVTYRENSGFKTVLFRVETTAAAVLIAKHLNGVLRILSN